MYPNQTLHTPGAPYATSYGLLTPPSGSSGHQHSSSSTVPNAPYMGSVPLPRTPHGGYHQLPSPPESPSAARHASPSLGKYISYGHISYDVRYPPTSGVNSQYLGQFAADRSITIYIPALGDAVGVGLISVPCPARGSLIVHVVLDCLYRHLSSYPLFLLNAQQRAAIESWRIRERGPGSPPALRDLLQGNTIFQGLFIQNNAVIAQFGH